MNWTSNRAGQASSMFAELEAPVGRAGTTDSVALISAIWWAIRLIKPV